MLKTNVPGISAHMIKIVKDIESGLNTNNLLAAKWNVSSESMCSQISRLRRIGVISAIKVSLPGNTSLALVYTYTGKEYIETDKSIGNQRVPNNVLQDEPKYACLDEFIYSWPDPKRAVA